MKEFSQNVRSYICKLAYHKMERLSRKTKKTKNEKCFKIAHLRSGKGL